MNILRQATGKIKSYKITQKYKKKLFDRNHFHYQRKEVEVPMMLPTSLEHSY